MILAPAAGSKAQLVFWFSALGLAAACGAPASSSSPAASIPAAPANGESEPAAAVSELPFFESFIGNVPIERSPEVPSGLVEISLSGFSGNDYAELGRRAGARLVPNGRLQVALDRLTNAGDPPREQHRTCSFVVDCDEAPVREVAARARAELGERPDMSGLAKFVDSFITDKSLARSEDLPSQIAVKRAGDCTEHALLFVALARSFEVAARDVSGFVLIGEPGRAPRQAFGHAWAEVHDGKRWRRVDPSLGVGLSAAAVDPTSVVVSWPAAESGKTVPYELRYLPMRVRGDEGPGYERENERGLNGLHVEALWWPAAS